MEFEVPKTAEELGIEIEDNPDPSEERYYTLASFLGAGLAKKLDIDQKEGEPITHFVVFTFDREMDGKIVSYEVEKLTYNALFSGSW